MKFMVINKPTGQNHAKTSASTKIDAEPLKALLKDGTVEVAYSRVDGGHIYVVTADSMKELVYKVRGNPFFEDSDTEVIPIMDAVDFLEGLKADKASSGRSRR